MRVRVPVVCQNLLVRSDYAVKGQILQVTPKADIRLKSAVTLLGNEIRLDFAIQRILHEGFFWE